MEFNYIRNKIRKFKKEPLLERCYIELNKYGFDDNKISPIWNVFTLMKWTYLYAEENYPYKEFTEKDFTHLMRCIYEMQDKYLAPLAKKQEWHYVFLVFHSQQFYLQNTITKYYFVRQLKLYCSLMHKYDFGSYFMNKTGLSLLDLIQCNFFTWVFLNAKRFDATTKIAFNGYLPKDYFLALTKFIGIEKVLCYLKLLTFDFSSGNTNILEYKKGLRNSTLQPFETTFFTMYPFQNFKGSIHVIHKNLFNYTANHFIYDYLKANDARFTEEFGKRFEKYIELGIKEMEVESITENELRKQIGKYHKVVDFIIEKDILIECKAIELQSYPSVNPTDELLYNALEDSIIKAYSQQMLKVVSKIDSSSEYWGIIVIYKEFYFGSGISLKDIFKKDLEALNEQDLSATSKLPLENLYIMDIATWDILVQIVKIKKINIKDILKKARSLDLDPSTRKLLFNMHLDEYELGEVNIEYLDKEFQVIDAPFKS